jgi:hypothetical protein
MLADVHERARFLIDEARVAGISHEDSRWLRDHLAACAACARFEETTARIVKGLDGFSFETAPRIDARALAGRRAVRPWRWALAAAALLVLASLPVYQRVRADRREQEDTQLLLEVQRHVSRPVPRAMEPLMGAQQ